MLIIWGFLCNKLIKVNGSVGGGFPLQFGSISPGLMQVGLKSVGKSACLGYSVAYSPLDCVWLLIKGLNCFCL